MKSAIVLAAGKSSRMKSNKIKVLHNVIDKSIIKHVAEVLDRLNLQHVSVVVGNQSEDVVQELADHNFLFDTQYEQLGTAHAVASASSLFEWYLSLPDSKKQAAETIIVMGDSPLLEVETLNNLITKNKNAHLSFATTKFNDAKHYGRIVRWQNGEFLKIVEFANATEKEREIDEVNTGVYCIKTSELINYLPNILGNSSGSESKFTDIAEEMMKDKKQVNAVFVPQSEQFLAVNDRYELNLVQQQLIAKTNKQHMLTGATLLLPQTIVIGTDVVLGADVLVEPNVQILGKSVIDDGVVVGSGSVIINSVVGKNSVVKNSRLQDSVVGEHCVVGPYAFLRQNTELATDVKIGAFVEVKNSKIGNGSRAVHLSYLGDSVLEDNVNIGCGVVTVNYDGKQKHKTIIKSNAFVGSNVNLIAPITIGQGVVVGAGSTIAQDVPDDDMIIERSQAVIKKGYGKKYLQK